ncbi:hypothetical protein LIER_15730 [Lithospermum erythrorhizon]|uniref:Gag-pol polyprotein n=1 Tax=Lithospermum erythrorhizon TaxID=34254 RepID=A0AAV3Q8L6_LITER
MEGVKEGSSITRPLLLDGTNYPYWKAKMTAFLRSVDTKNWKAMLTGWTTLTQNSNARVDVVKYEVEWIPEVFKLISSSTVAKKAWEIMKTAMEGLKKSQLLRKQHDLTTMRIDELIGNLTNFEMMFESSESNKKKVIALQASCEYKDEEDLAETGMIKGIKMINSRTTILDEILFQGKRSGDNIGIGFFEDNNKKRMASPTRKWVATGTKSNHNSERKLSWRFYYYGKRDIFLHIVT